MKRWGLGLAVALSLIAALPGGAMAAVADGPRLGFVKWGKNRLALLSVDGAGHDLKRLAGGPGKAPLHAPVPFQGPTWSPDGGRIAFAGYSRAGKRVIFVGNSDGSGLRAVPRTRGVTHPVFAPDGHTLAFARSRLHIPPFDPMRPLESALRDGFAGTTAWLVDLETGEQRRLTRWRDGLHVEPSSFSPDGSLLAMSRSGPRGNEAVAMRLADRETKVLARNAEEPAYSPDGSRIAFVSYRDRNVTEGFGESVLAGELYVKPVVGAGLLRLTHTHDRQESSPSWDPSGERLAYLQSSGPEPIALGFTNAIKQINADGTCRGLLFGKQRRARGDTSGLYGPAWQPGPGREAGRIACSSRTFGSKGSGNGELESPADVEVDPDNGDILVADRGNHRIQRFSSRGKYLSRFGSRGSGNGQLTEPTAVAIDSVGNIWVGDSGNHRIQKFDSSGKYLLKCGSRGVGNGQFSRWGPKGIAVDSEDSIWVTDYSGRVQKFSSSCKYQDELGSTGTGKGQFVESAGIDIGPDGRIWVSEWKASHRVSVFNPTGAFLFDFGSEGSRYGQFKHPDGVEVDSEGRVWVLDEGNSRVQRFNQAGKYQSQFGSDGSGKGRFEFAWPGGLTSDGKGGVWVTDTGNHRIQKWPSR